MQCFRGNHHFGRIALTCLLFAFGNQVQADYWHNASLATATIDQWLADVKKAIPEIDEKLKTNSLRASSNPADLKKLLEDKEGKTKPASNSKAAATQFPSGGKIKTKLTPQQQALLGRKLEDCAEILAYMSPDNINNREFPNFEFEKIPEYRRTAKYLLELAGLQGLSTVSNRLQRELMQGSEIDDRNQRLRISLHEDYYQDLLEILQAGISRGEISETEIECLKTAAAGKKQGKRNDLAAAVRGVLSLESAKIVDLLKILESQDETSSGLRKLAEEILSDRLPKATLTELQTAQQSKSLSTENQNQLTSIILTRLAEAPIPSLMSVYENAVDTDLRKAATQELAKRNPKYSEVKDQLEGIWTYAQSTDDFLASEAQRQAVNAFQRAPMSQCLIWLGNGDKTLDPIIWKQIDGRIDRADAARRALYHKVAIATLLDKTVSRETHLASFELFKHLKGNPSTSALVESITQLPRDLWPIAGKTLHEITGQKFGPHENDGVAEVIAAVKKWRIWLKENE